MTQEIAFDEPAGPIILGACVVSGRRDLPAGERLAARRDPALGHWLVTPSDRRRRSGERIFARKVRILTGDRKSVVKGKSVLVRVDLGGRRILHKQTIYQKT